MVILNAAYSAVTNATVNPLDGGVPLKPTEDISRIYSLEDKQYVGFLQQRLEKAKRQKDQPYPEYGWKNYYTKFQSNEEIANTVLPAKRNEDDVIVSAGTVESKLHALLSNINNLDLSAEFFAYDEENNRLSELGVAITDIVRQTEELDGGDGAGDEEKKIQRQLELLKQGTVFVQEEWVRRFEMKKKLTEKYNGQFKDFKAWTEDLVKVFEGPARTLIYGPNMFLGNILEFEMGMQPYIFTVTLQDYDVAKSRFGKLENWKYVKKGQVTNTESRTIYDNNWRLTELQENQVEIIMYQDKFRDEFQIIINGVCMMPIGFPLSAVSPGGEYNIAKQVFRIINSKFAYGKAFVDFGSVKELAALVDEMLKLSVLKTRKSFAPPYVNTSGRVISSRVLSPGRITMGIPADALQPIGTEGQGMTQSEAAVLQQLQDWVDKSTVSDTFTGQAAAPNTTATQILEQQRQARLTLGLTITVCALLEKKLAYLRLYNILQNYFNPVDDKVEGEVDEMRKLVKKFRNTNREVNIEGEGMGERKVIPLDPTDEDPLPSPEEIREEELQEEKERGIPIRKLYLNAREIPNARLLWYAVVNPREKESSPFFKVQFREMLSDVIGMVNLGSQVNLPSLEEEFSRVWQKSRSKLFVQTPSQPDMSSLSALSGGGGSVSMPGGGAVPGLPAQAGVPAPVPPV